jgi:hypothetical protein
MEREVRSQFDEVWAILERTAQRGEQAEARFNRRMDAAEKRMDRADKQIEATRKLVVAGMKILMQDRAEIKSLGKRMDAFLRSAGNGHNGGNGHGPKRSR